MRLKKYNQFINEEHITQEELDSIIQSKGLKYVGKNGSIKYYSCDYDVVIPAKLVENGKLIIRFKEAGADFTAKNIGLTSLEGFPDTVEDTLNISNNQINSLEHCPAYIDEHFIAENNPLKNLKYFPKSVGRYINLANCELTSLVGLPENVLEDLHVENNKFETLEGSPKSIDGAFMLTGNLNLTSLEGCPGVIMGDFGLAGCDNLNSLYGITHRVHKVIAPDHLKVEEDFINNYEMSVLHSKNYWKELLEYVLKNGKDINSVNWPEGMVNDDLRKSGSVLHKYKF